MLREVTKLCKGDFSGLKKEYQVYQGDIFSEPFVLKTFKNKDEAEAFADETQKESSKYDAYTCFFVKEVQVGAVN